MKLQILSDLHIDSYQRKGRPLGDIPKTDADLIILAGDISNSSLGMQWAIAQADKLAKPILYIAGNHEYFDENIDIFDKELAKMAHGTGVTFLQEQSYEQGGMRFLGCTLWTGFNYGLSANETFKTSQGITNSQTTNTTTSTPYPTTVPEMMQFATQCMRDYRSIRSNDGHLTPENILTRHHKQRAWLQTELQNAHAEKIPTVAIVHHGVSPTSIAPKYRQYPNNATFINDLSSWMHQAWAPKLWVHGHVHDAFDYECGNTRVVVNPRAYPSEISTTIAFDWAKVVEIS